jgi:hypothetical protein
MGDVSSAAATTGAADLSQFPVTQAVATTTKARTNKTHPLYRRNLRFVVPFGSYQGFKTMSRLLSFPLIR